MILLFLHLKKLKNKIYNKKMKINFKLFSQIKISEILDPNREKVVYIMSNVLFNLFLSIHKMLKILNHKF